MAKYILYSVVLHLEGGGRAPGAVESPAGTDTVRSVKCNPFEVPEEDMAATGSGRIDVEIMRA